MKNVGNCSGLFVYYDQVNIVWNDLFNGRSKVQEHAK